MCLKLVSFAMSVSSTNCLFFGIHDPIEFNHRSMKQGKAFWSQNKSAEDGILAESWLQFVHFVPSDFT